MKIINYGEHYEIYSDDLRTFDKLPAHTYKVQFNPMSGFSLLKIDSFETIEEKIYGNHMEKITKVLNSYEKFNRSLGVILSGDKGMGKSLFTQLLASEAIARDLPVIMVTKAFPGVADFIERIDQEALVIFDEFEKVFSIDGEKGETQNNLLGLFDGTSQKKRIYALTVNELHRVSKYMMSRTGRFHYHIRFDYPTASEIEIYLRDKLEEQYYSEIKHVIAFTNRVKLNYDSLRAIAFEINMGYSFRSSIGDLNILATETQRYNVKVNFSNGKSTEFKQQALNLFSESVQLNDYIDDGDFFRVAFNTDNIQSELGEMVVSGEHVQLNLDDDNGENKDEIKVVSITINHAKDIGVNYKLAS